jgi:hypothetical protein
LRYSTNSHFAIFALKIRRGKTGEQQAGLAETLEDSLPPVLHSTNFLLVEERHEFALREGSEVGLDAFDKLGDAALLVVAPRVADEKVVRHILLFLFHGSTMPEPAQLGPGVGHQFIALPHHVAERRGNEEADAAIVGGGARRHG